MRNYENYLPIHSLPKAELDRVGLTDRVYSLVEFNGGSLDCLYIIQGELMRPIAYFDKRTGFEFHFTRFLGEWEDVSQLQRFGKQLKLHKPPTQLN